MSKAQTDIRTTSYNAATANPAGYEGTLDEALAQVRAEPDETRTYWPLNISRERHELLGFLGVFKPKSEMSGIQRSAASYPGIYIFPMNDEEDDSVEYGAPDVDDALLVELFDQPKHSRFSLEYAMARWPQSFKL